MVAVKQFFDAAESQGRDVKVRRAQLRIVSPALEALGDMPAHVQTVAAAILKQIDDRAFRPIATATTLQEASEQATKAFHIFANLWPTLLGALIPWMQENPERFATMRHVATDVWTSTEAGRSRGGSL